MATITKRELVLSITNKLGLNGTVIRQQDVQLIVQSLIEEITNSLAQGNNVVMRNFGAFDVREMKAKIGRNPKNPAKNVPIPARAVVKFKPGKEMEARVREMDRRKAEEPPPTSEPPAPLDDEPTQSSPEQAKTGEGG